MKLYVVCGTHGEYDDWNHWVHGVYDSEERAKAVIQKLLAAQKDEPEPFIGYNRYDVETYELNAE